MVVQKNYKWGDGVHIDTTPYPIAKHTNTNTNKMNLSTSKMSLLERQHAALGQARTQGLTIGTDLRVPGHVLHRQTRGVTLAAVGHRLDLDEVCVKSCKNRQRNMDIRCIDEL